MFIFNKLSHDCVRQWCKTNGAIKRYNELKRETRRRKKTEEWEEKKKEKREREREERGEREGKKRMEG